MLLEPLAKTVANIPNKLRQFLFVFGGCVLLFQHFLHSAGVWQVRYLYEYTIGCFGFGLMILMLLKPGLSPIEFDKKVMLPWFGFGMMVLLSGIVTAYDYLPNALLFLIAYPIFFLVGANQPKERLFGWLHQIADLSFLGFFVCSTLFFPMESTSYLSFFTNQNGTAAYLMVPFCCALCGLLNPVGSLFQRCKDLVVLGLSGAFLYLTTSRTVILAVLGASVVALFLAAVLYKREMFSYLIKRCVPMVVVVYLAIPGVVVLNENLSYFWVAPVTPVVDEKIPEQSASQPPEQSVSQPPEQSSEEEQPSFQEAVEERNKQKFDITTKRSLNSLTTGRWYIWKAYVARLNWTGHTSERFTYYRGPEYEYLGDRVMAENPSAHMTILQFAYSNGVLAGLCFLLINLIAGIKSILYTLQHGKEPYGFFPVVLAAAFVLSSLFESKTSPISDIDTFYYLASLVPLTVKTYRPDIRKKRI